MRSRPPKQVACKIGRALSLRVSRRNAPSELPAKGENSQIIYVLFIAILFSCSSVGSYARYAFPSQLIYLRPGASIRVGYQRPPHHEPDAVLINVGGNPGSGNPALPPGGPGGYPQPGGPGGYPQPGGPGGYPQPGGPGGYPQPGGPGVFPQPGGHGGFPQPRGPGGFPQPGGPGYFPQAGGPGYFPQAGGPGYFPQAGGPGVFPQPSGPGVFPQPGVFGQPGAFVPPGGPNVFVQSGGPGGFFPSGGPGVYGQPGGPGAQPQPGFVPGFGAVAVTVQMNNNLRTLSFQPTKPVLKTVPGNPGGILPRPEAPSGGGREVHDDDHPLSDMFPLIDRTGA
ncbi:hypothetical protein AVEN_178660-1 [Araneus ventricosus]|uniref:Uncharacterized protein n=2 Tax=Araneus ventricosus TaxID=182803 RepID=A0A4Y2WNV8_ARAVE|nr:hypothetical protein AVEN_244861-1 [Araneus ventricosus]GBO38072.1 hypothetical protein AVEN_178660-1 [Araneus ventricosus]